MRVSVKQTVSWLLAVTLVLPGAMILSSPLEADAAETSTYADSIPAQPVKLAAGETAEDVIKNPPQPDIYTLSNDYEVERYDNREKNYQSYVATVGAAATKKQKEKVNKTITLPDFAGYDKPKDGSNKTIDKYNINYDGIVAAANGTGAETTGNPEYGIVHKGKHEYLYEGKTGSIKVRHVFQELKDFSKYGNLPGKKDDTFTTQTGKAGQLVPINPLPADKRPGFKPESGKIKVLIAKKSITVDLRYNRDHFDVTYDTADGTSIPARTLYYGQVIPPLVESDIPTRIGAKFVGWQPSVDLQGSLDGSTTKTFKANETITDSNGKPIKNLDAELILPASNVKFTAVWENNEKANYAIQFWTEKADHAEDASLVDKYEFMGTRVYKDQRVGDSPDLAAEPVDGLVFPDLDQARLKRIWNGEKFSRYQFLYLNKFYTFNKDLTNSENADKNGQIKTVSPTGKTVYNIYYDRQVYELYFTKSNDPSITSFYPEIWRHGTKLGGPGNPYHFQARFNQRMLEWPNDALETKGFAPGMQSFGWGPNFDRPQWTYRDTPPYRLSADEFLDMKNYTDRGGYTSTIDAGKGVTIRVNMNAKKPTFTTLSFGIEQKGGTRAGGTPIPHHMDFWMDGFNEKPSLNSDKIIDYDLYRTKSDTDSDTYRHKPPVIQGFTPYEPDGIKSKQLTEDELKDKNYDREAVTPFPNETVKNPYGEDLQKGKMQFMNTFFNRADEFGDPQKGTEPFDKNGYIRFYYHRNKYPLRFNIDPTKPKDDRDYNDKNQTKIFYQKTLKELNLDNADTLSKMRLDDLVETDSDGNTRIKRPEGLEPNKVFKGWALDPAGLKMLSTSENETMPHHALVLYAIWEEPDFKWKVTFDPDGGNLPEISENTLAKKTEKNSRVTPVPAKSSSTRTKKLMKVTSKSSLSCIAKSS